MSFQLILASFSKLPHVVAELLTPSPAFFYEAILQLVFFIVPVVDATVIGAIAVGFFTASLIIIVAIFRAIIVS